MHTDAFGFTHPDTTDRPSLLGALHIAECGQCQKVFGPIVTTNALLLGEAYEKEQRNLAMAAIRRPGRAPLDV